MFSKTAARLKRPVGARMISASMFLKRFLILPAAVLALQLYGANAQLRPQQSSSTSTLAPQDALREAQADILAKRWSEARRKLDAAAAQLEGSSDFQYLRGVIELHEGHVARAIVSFNRAIALDPRKAAFYLMRGQAYERLGDVDSAGSDYALAAEIDPRDSRAVLLLVKAHVNASRPAEALPALERAIKGLPLDAGVRYEHGRVLELLGRLSEARASYEEAVRLNPSLALAHAALGRTLREDPSALERSASHLERALELNPQNAVWHYELGQTYMQRKLWEQAQTSLERAASIAPKEPRVYSALAEVYRQRGMTERAREARRLFGELAQKTEREKLQIARLEADFKRAQDLEDAGKTTEAEALYERILSESPEEPQAHFALARLHLNARDHAQADEHLTRAIALRPESSEYRLLYALSLYGQRRAEEAERETRKVIEARPDESAPHNLLGNILLLRGRTNEALASYLRAVELAPDEPGYRLNLANAYRRIGDETAAQRELEIHRRLTTPAAVAPPR